MEGLNHLFRIIQYSVMKTDVRILLTMVIATIIAFEAIRLLTKKKYHQVRTF